jgi:hypothetical protein
VRPTPPGPTCVIAYAARVVCVNPYAVDGHCLSPCVLLPLWVDEWMSTTSWTRLRSLVVSASRDLRSCTTGAGVMPTFLDRLLDCRTSTCGYGARFRPGLVSPVVFQAKRQGLRLIADAALVGSRRGPSLRCRPCDNRSATSSRPPGRRLYVARCSVRTGRSGR